MCLDADFLLQIVVVQLQPLAQSLDLVERRAQFFVGFAALGDVAEHDHGADQAPRSRIGVEVYSTKSGVPSLRQNTSLST